MSSDRLLEYWNANTGLDYNIELIYSTPSMYVDAIKEEKIAFSTKYDDMFPYADSEDSYWTGFFTSRANDKSYFRLGSHMMHSSNKLFAMSAISFFTSDDKIEKMMESKGKMLDAIGIAQHHDGITGTEKQHVSDDYKSRMYNSIEETMPKYVAVIE